MNNNEQTCTKYIPIVLVTLAICCITFTILCMTEKSKSSESFSQYPQYNLIPPINLQHKSKPVEVAPNQFETCGPCIPSENPNVWIKRCIVKNANGYPLGSYVMTKLCSECVDMGNNSISCNSFNQPSGTFEKNIEFKKPRGTMCS